MSFSHVELRYPAFKMGAIENLLLSNLTIQQGSLYLDTFPVFEVKGDPSIAHIPPMASCSLLSDSTVNITNVVFRDFNQNTGMYTFNSTLNVKALQIHNCSYGGFGLYSYSVATFDDVIMTSSYSESYGALASGEASSENHLHHDVILMNRQPSHSTTSLPRT